MVASTCPFVTFWPAATFTAVTVPADAKFRSSVCASATVPWADTVFASVPAVAVTRRSLDDVDDAALLSCPGPNVNQPATTNAHDGITPTVAGRHLGVGSTRPRFVSWWSWSCRRRGRRTRHHRTHPGRRTRARGHRCDGGGGDRRAVRRAGDTNGVTHLERRERGRLRYGHGRRARCGDSQRTTAERGQRDRVALDAVIWPPVKLPRPNPPGPPVPPPGNDGGVPPVVEPDPEPVPPGGPPAKPPAPVSPLSTIRVRGHRAAVGRPRDDHVVANLEIADRPRRRHGVGGVTVGDDRDGGRRAALVGLGERQGRTRDGGDRSPAAAATEAAGTEAALAAGAALPPVLPCPVLPWPVWVWSAGRGGRRALWEPSFAPTSRATTMMATTAAGVAQALKPFARSLTTFSRGGHLRRGRLAWPRRHRGRGGGRRRRGRRLRRQVGRRHGHRMLLAIAAARFGRPDPTLGTFPPSSL